MHAKITTVGPSNRRLYDSATASCRHSRPCLALLFFLFLLTIFVVRESYDAFFPVIRDRLHTTTRDTSIVLVHYIDRPSDVDIVRTLIYTERVIGGWEHDIVVLSAMNVTSHYIEIDENVRVVYTPHGNPIIALHLELDHPSLSDYTVVQYQHIHAVVSHPIKQIRPEDFVFDPVILLDRACDKTYDSGKLLSGEIPDVSVIRRVFLNDFPGADTPTNGPNNCAAGGFLTYAILMPRFRMFYTRGGVFIFESITRLMYRYSMLTIEQVTMLAYWGKFETTDLFHTECYGGRLGEHALTRLIWVNKTNGPISDPASPYYGYFHTMNQLLSHL